MTHEERVWHHEMETLEGIHEHAERIASLEEFASDMFDVLNRLYWNSGVLRNGGPTSKEMSQFYERARKLDIEVPS